GDPVLTRNIALSGVERIDIQAATATLTAIQLKEGEPFDEAAFEESKSQIANALANGGYAYSKVEGTAKVDIATRSAEVSFAVEPGQKVRIGRVSIAGLKEISEAPVREVFVVKEGDPYSRESLE